MTPNLSEESSSLILFSSYYAFYKMNRPQIHRLVLIPSKYIENHLLTVILPLKLLKNKYSNAKPSIPKHHLLQIESSNEY